MKFVLLLLFAFGSTTSTLADESPESAPTAKPFVHPGLLHSRAELAFIQEKLATGQQPWKSAWEQLQSSDEASLDYTPKPCAKVVRGVRNNPNIGSTDMSRDAAAAYAHALQWSLTQKKEHAIKAIEILNAWTNTLESVSGHDARLLVGMDGVAFCNAAELMRHTSTQWRGDDQMQFERLLRQVFYPVIEDFHPTANGNWDASMIQTMIAMGVFLDDRAMFNRAVDYYLHGKGNGAIERYFNEFGECQESGRDQSHVQMGIGFLACACEMAWKQGVDLYGAADNRLALGFEYTAKYNLGEDVPYQRYRSVEGRYDYPTISRKGRGRFRPIYERIVHHHHDRLGLEMPYSRKVTEKERPEGSHRQHMSWGTLTSYGLPVPENSVIGKSVVIGEHPVVLGHGAGMVKSASRNTFMVFGNTYVTSPEKAKASVLSSINKAVDDADIDFVIMVGELTISAAADQFAAIKYVMDNSPVPVYVTASNHDLVYDNGDWKTGTSDNYARFSEMLKTEAEYTISKGRSLFIMQSHQGSTGASFTNNELAKVEDQTGYDFVYHVVEASLGAEINRKSKPIIGINGGHNEVKYHVVSGRHVKVVPIENKLTDDEDDYLIFEENDGYVVVDSYVDRSLSKSFKIVIDRSSGTCSVETR